MNGGAFGENFPYNNFHDLNMDWIIKITKDFLDQYTHIQEVITNGEQSLLNLTADGLIQLQTKADALEALLQQWYDTHSQDIANQLADALSDLNNWYITHEGYLNQYLTDSINAFNQAADQKAQQTISTIPEDYTTLFNQVIDLKSAFEPVKNTAIFEQVTLLLSWTSGYIKADGTVESTSYAKYSDYFDCSNYIYIKHAASFVNKGNIAFYDDEKSFISSIAFSNYTEGTMVEFPVPNNAKYCRTTVSNYIADHGNIYGEVGIKGVATKNKSDIADINLFIDQLSGERHLFTLVWSDGYINSVGEVVSSSFAKYSDYMECDDCISIYQPASFVTVGNIAFYDSSKEFISAVAYKQYTEGSQHYFRVPDGAKYFRTTASSYATTNSTFYGIVKITKTVSDMAAFDDSLYVNKDKLAPIWQNGYIDASGNAVSADSVRYSDYIDCTNYGYVNQVTSFVVHGHIAFYDTNYDVVFVYSYAQYSEGTRHDFKVPDDAKYFRTTSSTYVVEHEHFYGVEKPGYTLKNAAAKGPVIHVEKNGSGDYTKLTDAIIEAVKHMDSTVYVGDGVWDLIDEFGSTYMDSVSSSKRGLYLKNRVHVICSSKSVIKAEYSGSNQDTYIWFSPFNSGIYGFTLENATIIAKNVRYAFHDERDSDSDSYINKYINCNMYIDNTQNPHWHANQCIGGGLGVDGYIVVDNCIFDAEMNNNSEIVSWHNSEDWNYHDAQSVIFVRDCYFKRGTFRISAHGHSDLISAAYVSGCSLTAQPIIVETNSIEPDNVNVALVKWNNEVRT